MGLVDGRLVYAPIIYEQAMNYWLKQQQAFWLHTEINMSSDLMDWETKLTQAEKNLVGQVLKGFTQVEVVVSDYWRRVSEWFPHPEISMMAAAFSNMESIHTRAYAYLNDTLGLTDYSAFLQDPASKAKIDNLIDTKDKDLMARAKSLAVFSGFAEGVSLFSSFAILMNFSRFNKLKGVGQIVAFSVKDESLHAEAGSWLFRTLIKENPDLWVDDFKKDIYEAARIAVKLEDDFIDKAFELGPVEGLNPQDLKNFIRHRANTRLSDLGLKTNWKTLDKDSVERVSSWFTLMTAGVEHQDFFAAQPAAYSRGTVDFSKIFED